jgi:hypothetical protein
MQIRKYVLNRVASDIRSPPDADQSHFGRLPLLANLPCFSGGSAELSGLLKPASIWHPI